MKYLKVREGDKKEVARILKTVPVGATDERGQTALHIACEVDHIAFFFSFFLLNHCIPGRKRRSTPVPTGQKGPSGRG